MSKASLIFDDGFWRALEYLDNLRSKMEVCEVLHKLSISEKCLFDAISFMEELDYKIRVKERKNKRILFPCSQRPKLKLDLSFINWIVLQFSRNLSEHGPKASSFHEISKKLQEFRNKHPKPNISDLSDKDKSISLERTEEKRNTLIASIEEGLAKKEGIVVTLMKGRKIKVYPRELVYLDGDLSIVGEDISRRCLVYLALNEIKEVASYDTSCYEVCFSSKDIYDFIRAIRLEIGCEQRIVLKVYADKDINLSPNYHFLNNPFLVNNPRGDLIWAADMEVSDHLFHWLYSIKDDMEILNPESIKKGFTLYCTQKKILSFKD